MAIKSKKGRLSARQRNKFRIRKKVSGSDERPRLSVFKSGQHTYAQIIHDLAGKTVAAASTREKEVVAMISSVPTEGLASTTSSIKGIRAAIAVGKILADRAKAAGVSKVVFDRNGYVYHGRVKAVADGARQNGLDF
jgi:large subunit ribosomal protein L18